MFDAGLLEGRESNGRCFSVWFTHRFWILPSFRFNFAKFQVEEQYPGKSHVRLGKRWPIVMFHLEFAFSTNWNFNMKFNLKSHSSSVFRVEPAQVDISAGESVEFSMNFRPSLDNQYYGQRLECFVYFKTMRNHRLVTDSTITAPWCLAISAEGSVSSWIQVEILRILWDKGYRWMLNYESDWRIKCWVGFFSFFKLKIQLGQAHVSGFNGVSSSCGIAVQENSISSLLHRRISLRNCSPD